MSTSSSAAAVRSGTENIRWDGSPYRGTYAGVWALSEPQAPQYHLAATRVCTF
jgi:hypothetical protein